MDYQYENLDPDNFQELCQSILVKEFPNVQCLPVGQRDGGRDAIVRHYYIDSVKHGREKKSDEIIVFQVKFVRNPSQVKQKDKWLSNIVKEELPKIKELIRRGASAYYLLTNLSGTSALDTGSIDKLKSSLNGLISIPSTCWWRDDLNRRLNNNYDLKWVFPQLLTGVDVIRKIIENDLNENKQRRTNALRAYMRAQFDIDKEVRFKQVELQNKLFDLFIDVPLIRSERIGETPIWYTIRHIMKAEKTNIDECKFDYNYQRDDEVVGCAAMLLWPGIQRIFPKIVIEGAPGQGKSTIVQYVCQIHRQRILNEQSTENKIPAEHLSSPIYFPFKIDLRDLSAWLNKENPFLTDKDESFLQDWNKSLESFIAAQVRHFSGGATFSVDDLHAISKVSPILLVFDGLDEVADISRRKDVVNEIMRGVNRLTEIAPVVQSVVTSRPAAFVNSPGLSDSEFEYFELGSITRLLINEYAEKWLRAKRLQSSESADVRRILKDKLDLPHLRDLARNPMQLAILLSLIHTRGSSLPDKRTALYDNYIELFFSREAEKSSIVREHRELLIDIHRYVAWHLHSNSELGDNQGRIAIDELRKLVRDYLENELHDPELADRLFTSMVERVVALVSRIEGTFEFEVQPLREYFAARHLYNTAPYSPPGAEKKGTLPDRFDAIARNFYWLNVTRFYCGCYSKGELPSLVDRIEDLSKDETFRYTSHPQYLSSILLSDWVFAQHKKSMHRVVRLILDVLGLHQFLSISGGIYQRKSGLSAFTFPIGCGNEQVVERAFEMLKLFPNLEIALLLIDLIRKNTSIAERKANWISVAGLHKGANLTVWLEYSYHLGVLSILKHEEFDKYLSSESCDRERLFLVFKSRQIEYIQEKKERFLAILSFILDGEFDTFNPRRSKDSILDSLNTAFFCLMLSNRYRERRHESLIEYWNQFAGFSKECFRISKNVNIPPYIEAQNCKNFLKKVYQEASINSADWGTTLKHWNIVVEEGRSLFGDSWILFRIANKAAGITSKNEKCKGYDELFDPKLSLCNRARFARLQSGSPNYWEKKFSEASTQSDKLFALLVFFSWVGPATLTKLIKLVDNHLVKLESDQWRILFNSIEEAMNTIDQNHSSKLRIGSNLPARLSYRASVLIAKRSTQEIKHLIFNKYISSYTGNDPLILKDCIILAMLELRKNHKSWDPFLRFVSKGYNAGAKIKGYVLHNLIRNIRPEAISIKTAKSIVTQAEKYPSDLVSFAERRCRLDISKSLVPVAEIAKRDEWFDL